MGLRSPPKEKERVRDIESLVMGHTEGDTGGPVVSPSHGPEATGSGRSPWGEPCGQWDPWVCVSTELAGHVTRKAEAGSPGGAAHRATA